MDSNINPAGAPNQINEKTQPTPIPPMQPEQKPLGPVFGLIVILGLILIGGIYFLVSKKDVPPPVVVPQEESATEVQRITTQSTSDDTESIEADLNAFGEADINNVDSVE